MNGREKQRAAGRGAGGSETCSGHNRQSREKVTDRLAYASTLTAYETPPAVLAKRSFTRKLRRKGGIRALLRATGESSKRAGLLLVHTVLL